MSASSRETAERINALVGIGLRLANSAPSGRLALARLAAAVEPEWLLPGGEKVVAALESARATSREPLDRQGVERALRDAWGGAVSDELDEIDLAAPVAVTPTAQVHRALHDGAPVAVKVLRPGLAGIVRQDLALLDGLLAPLAAAFPALDPRALLREVRERVLEELDLEHEAANQRRFYRALRSHPRLRVPAPHTALAREGVCVSEWVDGTPLHQASQSERDAAAPALVAFVLGSLRFGLVHADPDPDDVLLGRDGRLAILDYGSVRETSSARLDAAARAVEAYAAGDAAGVAAAVAPLGWLPTERVPAALELIGVALGELATPGPSTLDSDAVLGVRDRAAAHPVLPALVREGRLDPEDMWPARGVAQLFGVIARAGATADWLELVRVALRDGWDAAA